MTLIETVTGMILMIVLGGTVLQILSGMFSAQRFTMDAPAVQQEATDLALQATAAARMAPLCRTAMGCGGVDASALSAANAGGFTVYTTAGGATRAFGTGGAAVATPATATAIPGGASATPGNATLACSYLINPDGTYGFSGDPTTGWVTTVSAADLPKLHAVRVVATVTRGGLTAVSRAEVRFRNSPLKRKSTD